MDKLCKFYIDGKCNKGLNCKFVHVDNICRDYYFKKCSRVDCKFIHTNTVTNTTNNNNKKHKNRLVKVNTETFEPNYDIPDMRVVLATPNNLKNISEHDVFLTSNLFDVNDTDIFYKLLDEINNSGLSLDELWKPWHGGTHLIADDHLSWKKLCPTFNMVVEQIREYFQIDIKATRFNLYEDLTDWKAYHFDAAAIDAKKALTQNMTIGVSFGITRDITFEHDKSKVKVSFPLDNGVVYGFGKQVNIDWRHGIPQIKPENRQQIEDNNENISRISIIVWGWLDQIKL